METVPDLTGQKGRKVRGIVVKINWCPTSLVGAMLTGFVAVLLANQPANATNLQQRCMKVSHTKNYQTASRVCLSAALELERPTQSGTAHQQAMVLAQVALDREAAAFGDVHMGNLRSDIMAEDEMQSAHATVNQALSIDPASKYIKSIRQRIYAAESQVRRTVLKRGEP